MTREEKLDWLYRLRSEIYVYMPKEWIIPMNKALDMSIKALEQEPKTGIWINWTDDRKDYLKCSVCGYGEEGEVNYATFTPYCPMCGSKMIEP